MSGPTLGLNITGSGQAKIEATTSAVERLVAALRTLPSAAAEIDKLNKALNKAPTGPSGLKGGAADLKELVGEFKALGAQLNTSFASLEETIKKGWNRAEKAQEEGSERQAKAAKRAAERLKQLDAAYTAAGAAGQDRLVLKARSQLDQGISPEGVAKSTGVKALEAAQALDFKQAHELRFAVENEAIRKRAAAMAKSLTDAEAEIAVAERAATARRVQQSVASVEAVNAARSKALTKSLKGAAGSEAGTRQLLYGQGPETAAALGDLRSYYGAMEDADRAAAARKAQLQKNSLAIAEAQRKAAETEAHAINDAMDRVLQAQRAADARYAAASPAQKARTVLGARALLDQPGTTPKEAAAKFGGAAVAAAEHTTLASAMQKVHGEVDRGVPKVEGYNRALRDMHSSLRGVASGFGQMALTWGAIGPLLAGAALSQSFVQSIKIGASVRQDLEELRVLSDESQAAVAGLEKQLISLGQTGPFGPREVAEAMKTLSLAGLDAQQVGQALKPALDFAVTGGVSIKQSSEALVAIGTAYGYQASEFGSVADAVAKAAAISMSSVSGMMESFRASSIVAQAYGVSLKDAASSQALLANIGIRGSAAGTAMRQMYSELSGATASTRNAMKQLGVEVVDQTGKMKPLLDIFIQLSGALDKYSGKAQVSAIQALSNERGSKSIVANLVAFRTQGKQQIDPDVAAVAPKGIRAEMEAIEAQSKRMGNSATTELERIRSLIEESAGFNAIAASQLASTPENLMKGVVASLQTSLFEAFKELEPTLIVAATQLRDVFNSQGFRDGITTVVKLMGDFTAAIIDNLGWVKALALGFAAFKGLQVLELMFSSAVVGMGLLNGSLKLTTTGLMSTAAAAETAAVGMGTLATASRVAGLALAVLGPLALALTAAAFAWDLYHRMKKDPEETKAEALAAKQANTLESLRKEKERLMEVAAEMSKGTEQRLAEVRAMDQQAAAQRRLDYDKSRSPLIERLTTLRSSREDLVAGGNTGTDLTAVDTQIARAEQALGMFDQSYAASERAIAREQQQVKALANGLDILGQAKRDKRGASPLGEDWTTAGQRKSAMDVGNAELDLLKKQYAEREQASQLAYRREMELLDIAHKGKLVSESAYSSKSEQLSAELYSRDVANLERYVSESGRLLEQLKADPKKAVKAKGIIEEIEATRVREQAQLDFLRKKDGSQQAARDNLSRVELDGGIAKLRATVTLQEEKFAADQRSLGMTPGMIAAEQAMTAVRAEGATALKKTVDLTIQAQMEMNRLMLEDTTGYTPSQEQAYDDRVAKLQAYINTLKARLVAAGGNIEEQAGKSGVVAKNSADFSAAGWKKWVAEGQNAFTVLEASRNEFVSAWINQGQSMWESFLKTGKVSWKSLGDLAIKTIADISYKQGIGQVFAKGGEGLFNRVAPLVQGNVSDESRRDLDSLKVASDELGQSMGKLGGSFWQLLQQVGQGFAAMFQQSGAGGSAGWLTKLFGGGGNQAYVDNSGMDGSVDWTVPSAKGNAFGAQGLIHAFAKGGLPMNTVINEPHYFRFGGGNLGVAGEAGPEAIMPLTRGSDGTLGVRAQGGGEGGSVNVTSKTTVVIENHSGGPEPVVQQQKQPNGDELIRVVIGAAAKDINRGGDLRKSMQGVQGRNNLPRY